MLATSGWPGKQGGSAHVKDNRSLIAATPRDDEPREDRLYALRMGTKSAEKVDFTRLAAALNDYRFAYLVTVDDDYRVHSVTVEPELRERVMDVGLVGGRTRRNVESRSTVTLLWPPSEPGGYSLIVDGRAEVAETSDSSDDTAALRVVPTRALLHRNADPNTPGSAKGCLHDCVVFSTP